jgi:hypothetical protein
MKLSVEAKVAAAVAVGLMVMTSGAMAQGRKGQVAGSNHYGPTNNPGVNTHMNQQGDNSSLFGRTNAEENKPTVSDEKVTSNVPQQGEDRQKARQQREERRDDRQQREERRDDRQQREERRDNRQQREERRDNRQQREERRDDRQQREERRDDRQQREERRDDRQQRQDRQQRNSTKDKSPFDGSILNANPST